jgi:hypothetical protein
MERASRVMAVASRGSVADAPLGIASPKRTVTWRPRACSVKQPAVVTLDECGNDLRTAAKSQSSDRWLPGRIGSRPVTPSPMRNFPGGEDDQGATASQPQVRRPQTGKAAFGGAVAVEWVHEEAQLAHFRNPNQQVIGQQPDVAAHSANQRCEHQAVKCSVRMVGRHYQGAVGRYLCHITVGAIGPNLQDLEDCLSESCSTPDVHAPVERSTRSQRQRPVEEGPRGRHGHAAQGRRWKVDLERVARHVTELDVLESFRFQREAKSSRGGNRTAGALPEPGSYGRVRPSTPLGAP